LLLLLTACASWPPWRDAGASRTTAPPDDTKELVTQAESLAQAGSYAQAVALFQEVARSPTSAFVDRALLGLTRSFSYPGYAGHDYRQAFTMADRLVREYPDSPFAVEGRAWRDLLLGYLVRGQELERRTQELERLKRLDLELEQQKRRP
jgi:outer membrane protein assembly factor BamD (BamD/ComL family)